MQGIKPRFLLVSIMVMTMVMTFFLSFGNINAQTDSDSLSIVGDPNFNKNNLSPEMRLWYDRLWEAINHPNESPDPDKDAASDHTYTLGRSFGDYIAALMAAFRATGDLRILDEADRLMEIAKGKLRDSDGDGHLNWIWRGDAPKYNGKDNHRMDEIMTHGNVALMAHALKSNARFNPRYAQHAEFWIDYMENHFLAKWNERKYSDPTLAHPFTNHMRLYYHMYKATGNPTYLSKAEAKENRFADHMEISPKDNNSFIWDHRVSDTEELGWQRVNYAHYVMIYLMDMAMEGFGRFASADYMARYASTWRDLVYVDGTSSMTYRIDGTGSRRFGLYSNAGLARWDATNTLFDLAERSYNPRVIHVPAYLLMVLSDRGNGGNSNTNQPPTAKITADILSGDPPLTVTFSSSQSTDPDGSIVGYVWNFGDGQTSQEQIPQPHTYDQTGQYEISLTVTDDEGAVGTDRMTIRVYEPGSYFYRYMEAEAGDLQSPMQMGSDPEASAGGYIHTPAGTGNTRDPVAEATYEINLGTSGTYYLWMSTFAPSASNDATYIGFNGSYERVFPGNTSVYEWVRVGEGHSLNAGTNRVNISHGEEMARVDRLFVTNDPIAIPEDNGEGEVCDGDLNTDGRIDVADLQVMVNVLLGSSPEIPCADLNNDGIVNVIDLQALINQILG